MSNDSPSPPDLAASSPVPIAVDLKFPEAPRWHDGALWISDQLGGHVLRVSGGTTEVVVAVEQPSGLGFLSDGTLRVAVIEPPRVIDVRSGTIAPDSADLSNFGRRLNDLVVDALDRTYVDVYQNYRGEPDSTLVLLDPRRGPRVVADGLAFPNGVAVTPDGATLIVSETYGERISAFDVAADGSLDNRRVWAPLPGMHPDGLCLDADGAAWIANYLDGEFLRVTEGGTVQQRIAFPGRWALSCCLGGDDGRTLFCCTAVTSHGDYRNGVARGFVDECRVDVESVGCP
jgi:sugar lactone lactonase YvrE